MELWNLYEDNGTGLYGVREGADEAVVIADYDGEPNWRSGETVPVGAVVGAREHRHVATLDGLRVVDRWHEGGGEAQDYLRSLAEIDAS